MIDWIKDNYGWICGIVGAICAVLTLLHLYFHKDKDKGKGNQTISNVSDSNINQAGGNIDNAKQRK